MFAIFDTVEAAEAYVAEVDAALGLPRPGDPPTPGARDAPGYGWTTTWAEPRRHPASDSWAVPSHPAVQAAKAVDALDESWGG